MVSTTLVQKAGHAPRYQPSSWAGFYDTQYANREKPDLRGRIHADKDGYFCYRAVAPVAYPIPGDVSGSSLSFPAICTSVLCSHQD